MLSLPPKPSPAKRVPIKRCYADLLTASGRLVERRCFGEVLGGGNGVAFIDPEHPRLQIADEWASHAQAPLYAAFVEYGGAAGRGKRAGANVWKWR